MATAKKAQAFSAKDRVSHYMHGPGTVVEMNERHTTIAFDDAGTRKFMTNMVQLERSDTLAPPKPVRRKKKATKAS